MDSLFQENRSDLMSFQYRTNGLFILFCTLVSITVASVLVNTFVLILFLLFRALHHCDKLSNEFLLKSVVEVLYIHQFLKRVIVTLSVS